MRNGDELHKADSITLSDRLNELILSLRCRLETEFNLAVCSTGIGALLQDIDEHDILIFIISAFCSVPVYAYIQTRNDDMILLFVAILSSAMIILLKDDEKQNEND